MQGNSNLKKLEVFGKRCVHRHSAEGRKTANRQEKAIETKTRQQGKRQVRQYLTGKEN